METPQTETDEKMIKRLYMREYMHNYNIKNRDSQNSKCLARYYKKKIVVSKEDNDKYGNYLALILKTKKCLETIKKECPQFLEGLFI